MREQLRAEAYAAPARQETEIQAKIDQKNVELAELQKEIKIWRARPNHPPKGVVLGQLLQKKADLIKYIDRLRKQLEYVRAMQAQSR